MKASKKVLIISHAWQTHNCWGDNTFERLGTLFNPKAQVLWVLWDWAPLCYISSSASLIYFICTWDFHSHMYTKQEWQSYWWSGWTIHFQDPAANYKAKNSDVGEYTWDTHISKSAPLQGSCKSPWIPHFKHWSSHQLC